MNIGVAGPEGVEPANCKTSQLMKRQPETAMERRGSAWWGERKDAVTLKLDSESGQRPQLYVRP